MSVEAGGQVSTADVHDEDGETLANLLDTIHGDIEELEGKIGTINAALDTINGEVL